MGEVAKIERVEKYTREQIDLIKSTICPNGITDQEFGLFLEVAKRTGLDPFQRQIHAIYRFDGQGEDRRRRLVIQTSIDGYRAIAQRNGLAGIEDAKFTYVKATAELPIAATVTVYRRIGDHRDAYTATARWSEYAPTDLTSRGSFMWRKMPHTMLAKCAESLALRKGFQEVGGVYTDDEMAQADEAPVITQAPKIVDPKPGTLGALCVQAGYETMAAASDAYGQVHQGIEPTSAELYRWLESELAPDDE